MRQSGVPELCKKEKMENTAKIPPYAHLIVKLFQNVIYDEDRKAWQDLITYQRPIREYFATIGVVLMLIGMVRRLA